MEVQLLVLVDLWGVGLLTEKSMAERNTETGVLGPLCREMEGRTGNVNRQKAHVYTWEAHFENPS